MRHDRLSWMLLALLAAFAIPGGAQAGEDFQALLERMRARREARPPSRESAPSSRRAPARTPGRSSGDAPREAPASNRPPAPPWRFPRGSKRLSVTFDQLPTDMASFLALRDRLATSPQGGVAMYLLAGYLYAKDPELGTDALTVAMDRKYLDDDRGGYQGWSPSGSFLRWVDDKLRGKPWMIQSYLAGTSPADGYTLPGAPYRFDIFDNGHAMMGDGAMRLMVNCNGADFPRPFTVRRNDKGIWKLWGGESTLYLDVKKPGTGGPDGDDL